MALRQRQALAAYPGSRQPLSKQFHHGLNVTRMRAPREKGKETPAGRRAVRWQQNG
jgi:hypothetical protein